ncbi:hypothetical protein SeLEV6574_g06193 [Synchytrium endobioticum]|uniref:P-loop containing nucleoside triphosphate hydrolase protein n=1 Tax=Synchytrium endobioticum TaxID=286115 RepID=A0A507CQ30_9FUNG|nr:hypothetical protein SeLEV6574_g06193 [Synchytrium endobioticum]
MLLYRYSICSRAGRAHLAQHGQHGQHASTVSLRPYQLECIDTCISKLQDGIKRQAVSLPVGSGKTVLFASLIPRIPGPQKALVLAHREELLDQAYHQCRAVNPHLKVSMDKGAVRADLDADVVVASVHTLGRSHATDPVSPRLALYKPELFKAIIIDEAHHATADVYQRILSYFSASNPGIFVWGCSATLRRHDGVSLGSVFDEIVYHKDIGEMIDAGFLCNIKMQAVATEQQWLKDVSSLTSAADPDYDANQLSHAVNTAARNEIIVQTYKQVVVPDGRRACLVFAADVAHATSLVDRFRSHGVDARCVHAATKPYDRALVIADFRASRIPVLVNCGILTEGTDVPCVDSILLARPTRSAGLLLQMLGRGLRLHPSKTDCLVLDFVDSTNSGTLLGSTAPTLLGLPADFDLQDLDIASAARRLRPVWDAKPGILEVAKSISDAEALFNRWLAQRDGAPVVDVSLTAWTNPFSAGHDGEDTAALRGVSRNAWVRVGPHKLVLNVSTRGQVVVQGRPHEDADPRVDVRPRLVYDVARKHKIAGAHVWSTDHVCTADLLSAAIRAADTYVGKNFPGMHTHLLRYAAWRNMPATEKQVLYLGKHARSGGALSGLDVASVTRGRAADLITKLLNGARGSIKGARVKK